jgi:dihydroorotate dehydrogenase electron transfer subunit
MGSIMCNTNSLADIKATVLQIQNISSDVSIITLECPVIASAAKPGNFVNIKVNDATQPLLRRPFSIHNVRGPLIDIMVKTIGRGTTLFCNTPPGSTVKVLGPLGNSFDLTSKPFRTAILVSGGIGTAPMLFLEKTVVASGKEVINLTGGRTKDDLLIQNLINCRCATDDGSAGFKGTVVELLRNEFTELKKKGAIKVFACGPNPMLKALAHFCHEHQLACDLSLESVMGCGIGICYGCSVEVKNCNGDIETILLCKDGPVINSELFTR